jgi:hypothetical protein
VTRVVKFGLDRKVGEETAVRRGLSQFLPSQDYALVSVRRDDGGLGLRNHGQGLGAQPM